jgi:tetratricopeptide (TPR) repeat protein
MYLTVLATLLLAIIPASAAAQTTETIRHHSIAEDDPSFPPDLVKAEATIEKKDYATAEPLLQKVLAAHPNNYEAWFDLGFVLRALGNTEGSIDAYRKSVAAKPDVFESNLNLGLSLVQSRNPDAEKFLRAATELKPTSHVEEGHARAWRSLAHLLEATKPDEAMEAYRKAQALQPRDIDLYLSAGLLFEKQNKPVNAGEEYKQALTLDPSSADALTALANLYMRGRQFSQAEENLRGLASLHPEDGAAHIQLGRVLAAEGKNDEAVTELQAGLKVSPGDNETRHDLADLFTKAGNYDEAENLYRTLLTQKPDDAQLHDDLGKVLLKQHKPGNGQDEFMAAVRLKPDFGAAYGDLAVAANENKDYTLAIKAADARAKFLPEIPISYFLRATAYDHLRDKKRAALNYHEFLTAANGKFPDQEWQARQRLKAIEPGR